MSARPEAIDLLATAREFAAAILGGPEAATPLLDRLHGTHRQNLNRLAAYHRNVVGNRIAALRSTYPKVVEQLTANGGEEAFAGLARDFALSHDATSGDLNEYGEDFADWLSGTAAADTLPWLPDLARLEWDAQTAWYAADCPPLDFAALAAVPAELHRRLRFRLAPAFHARSSAWPLAELWSGSALAIVPQQQWLWIVRPGDLVHVVAVSAADFAFIAELANQATLAEAIATTVRRHENFDVGHALVRAAGLGLLAGFHLSGESP